MPDEIDLNEDEEAALERAWDRIEREWLPGRKRELAEKRQREIERSVIPPPLGPFPDDGGNSPAA